MPLCHLFRRSDVSVVLNTSVFICLEVIVAVYCLHLIAVANITTENCRIEISRILVIIISSSVQVIYVKTESQLLVYIDREIRLKAFFSVYFITGFMIRQIGIRYVTIGEIELRRRIKKLEKGSIKIVGSGSRRSKKMRDIRGEPILAR